MRDGRLAAVLDFGGLSIGYPAIDLAVAWAVLDPPARETFRRQLRVDDATWLRGRAWALSITLMIWVLLDDDAAAKIRPHRRRPQRPRRRRLPHMTPLSGILSRCTAQPD